MIRFVDIRGQGTGYAFAFWDTVTDRFCEFGGEQAWEGMEDFVESFGVSGDVERFVRLMPDWAKVGVCCE